MQTIKLTKRQVDVKGFIRKTALETDTEIEVSEPTLFTLDEQPIILYGECDFELTDLKKSILNIKYGNSNRDGGLKTRSRVFGTMPRFPLINDYVTISSLAFEQPDEYEKIISFSEKAQELYQRNFPDKFFLNQKESLYILDCWRMNGTIFTSGVVNETSALKYHFDGGNFKNSMSFMVVFKKNVSGGCLSLPEYNVRLNLKDSSYLIFDGQSILHGVTPIRKHSEDAYRYSAVYYSLQKLIKAKSPEEELKSCRRRAMEKVKKRAQLT